jgi:hypothetical protein
MKHLKRMDIVEIAKQEGIVFEEDLDDDQEVKYGK